VNGRLIHHSSGHNPEVESRSIGVEIWIGFKMLDECIDCCLRLALYEAFFSDSYRLMISIVIFEPKLIADGQEWVNEYGFVRHPYDVRFQSEVWESQDWKSLANSGPRTIFPG
jgi:hypothetical protein